MTPQDLNTFAAMKTAGYRRPISFIPALDTGTMPQSQASAVSPVNITPNDKVISNAVPFVEGGYPNHLAPVGTPSTQNQRYRGVNFAPAPWVQVPSCAATQILQKSPGLAFKGQNFSGASLGHVTRSSPSTTPKAVVTFTTY
jgi:hypothetical protein